MDHSYVDTTKHREDNGSQLGTLKIYLPNSFYFIEKQRFRAYWLGTQLKTGLYKLRCFQIYQFIFLVYRNLILGFLKTKKLTFPN
jgi:hypothetical protein